MGQIQAATVITNYFGEEERAKDLADGGMQTAGVATDIASQNYIAAAIHGAKLAGGTANYLAKNAGFVDEEMKKINAWNEKYDSQGRLKRKSTFVRNAILLI